MAEIRQALYIGFFIKITIGLLRVGEVGLIILYSPLLLLTSTFYYSLPYTLPLYALQRYNLVLKKAFYIPPT
jgi:hypothetical protein